MAQIVIEYTPTGVWHSRLRDGTRVTYGYLPAHRHGFDLEDCAYSGQVVRASTFASI